MNRNGSAKIGTSINLNGPPWVSNENRPYCAACPVKTGCRVGERECVQSNLTTGFRALEGRFYSPFDFGDGRVTRPRNIARRFRRRLRLLRIPPDLSGQRVLGIGAWDGYFSIRVRAARR
jgi:hypothetical protein